MSAPEEQPDGWVVYGPDGEVVATGTQVALESAATAGEEP